MSEQVIEGGYLTVAQLAQKLGVGIHVVYRNVKAGTWRAGRTAPTPKAPIRFSPAQVAAIEALMDRNGETEYVPPAPIVSTRNPAIDRGMRRRTRP